MDACQKFLTQYHLLLLVVFELSLKDLLRFRLLPGSAKPAFNTEIVRRIFTCLDPFIPSRSAPAFFARLEECCGIITGSVVREILLLKIETLKTFTTLTIVIRHRAPSPLHKFLKQLGYTTRALTQKDIESRLVDLREDKNVVESVELHERVDASGQRFSIVLLISKREPVSLLLSCDNTADMVAISRDSIVAYYPRLTFADEGLFVNDSVGEYSSQMEITTDDEATLFSDNSHWKKPCGIYCPSVWRHSYDDDGVLKVTWRCPNEAVGVQGSGSEGEGGEGVGNGSGVGQGEMEFASGSTPDDASHVGSEDDGHLDEVGEDGEVGDRDEVDGVGDAVSQVNAQIVESENAGGVGEDWSVSSGGQDGGGWDYGPGWGVPNTWASEMEEHWNREWGWCASHFESCRTPLEDFTYGEILRWRVTNRCNNGQCPNSSLHDARSEYVSM